jgi:FHA domain-containing protein/tetratricopeptide repeat protein
MATLRWRESSGPAQIFRLGPEGISIGRDPGNTIAIPSAFVSKRHALVREAAAGFTLVDLGSSNGTLVNGRPVTDAVLKPGDTIEIGEERLVFEVDVPAGVGPPPRSPGRRPLIVAAGVGGLVIVALLALVVIGHRGSSSVSAPAGTATPSDTQQPSSAPPGGLQTYPIAAPGTAPVPAAPPLDTAVVPPPAVASPSGALAVTPVAPAPVTTAPVTPGQAGANPDVLYDLAIAHIKGGRLVDARRLLAAALARAPGHVPARERLRQVEAAIQIETDRHLAAGQRAFTYLKFEDAIIEWEQVIAMADPADPRYRQAADGINRARARLAVR